MLKPSALLALLVLTFSTTASAQLFGFLDRTAPTVSVLAPASGALLTDVAQIEANASDGMFGSGISAVEYQVDATTGAWMALSMDLQSRTWKASWNVSSLSDGGHFLYVRATDRGGNVTTVYVSVLTGAPPSVPQALRVSPPPSPSNGGYLDVSWNANGEADLAGYFLYRSNAFAGPYARVATLASPELHDVTVKNGVTYYYQVSAFDTHGNESALTPVAQGVAQDTKAPTLSAISAAVPRSDQADITWNTDEGARSQVLYGDTPSLGSATVISMQELLSHAVSLTALEPSTTYYYRVRSVDAAGNASTSDVFSFSTPVDLPPTLTIVSPGNGAMIQGPTAMQVTATDDAELALVEYSFDGIQWAQMPFNSFTGFYEARLEALPDGQHTIGARATDEVGQVAQQAITVTVDQHVPTVEWITPAPAAHLPGGAEYIFQVEAHDGALAAVEYQVYFVPAGVEVEEAPPADPAAWQPLTYNWQTGFYEAPFTAPISLNEIVAYVYARATDSAGKYSIQTREVSFVANGVEFSFVGTGGQSLFGVVAIEPLGPNGENIIGIEARAREGTPGGTYTITVSANGVTHQASFNADARGRGEVILEEATTLTDEFSVTITPSGPGF